MRLKNRERQYLELYPLKLLSNDYINGLVNDYMITDYRKPYNPLTTFTSETLFQDPLYRRFANQAHKGEHDPVYYTTWFGNDRRKLKFPERYDAKWEDIQRYWKADSKGITDKMTAPTIKDMIDATKIMYVRENPDTAVVTDMSAMLPYHKFNFHSNIDLYDKGIAVKIIRLPRMVMTNRPNLIDDICNVEAWILRLLGVDIKKMYVLAHIDSFGMAGSSNLHQKEVYLLTTPIVTSMVENRLTIEEQYREGDFCSPEFIIERPEMYEVRTSTNKIIMLASTLNKAEEITEACHRATYHRSRDTKHYYIDIEGIKHHKFKTLSKDNIEKRLEEVHQAHCVHRTSKPYMCNYGCKYNKICNKYKKELKKGKSK